MVGEFDAPIDQLEYLLSIPATFSVQLLRLDPFWDPFRDHPRFQALLDKYESLRIVITGDKSGDKPHWRGLSLVSVETLKPA